MFPANESADKSQDNDFDSEKNEKNEESENMWHDFLHVHEQETHETEPKIEDDTSEYHDPYHYSSPFHDEQEHPHAHDEDMYYGVHQTYDTEIFDHQLPIFLPEY